MSVCALMGQKEVSFLQEWYILGVGKGVLFREVSSVQRLARVVLGVGKGVLFREVSSVQEWFHCIDGA